MLFDARWIGEAGRRRNVLGIARFGREIRRRAQGWSDLDGGLGLLHPLEPLWLDHVIRRRGPAVYLSPGFNPPYRPPSPFIFTIHDLIHLHFADERSLLKQLYYDRIVRPAVHRARFVLTVSEFTRSAIIEWSRVDEARVVVVGNGVATPFQTEGPEYVLGEGEPYLLHVGSRKPHRNIPRLLDAFGQSCARNDFKLVFAGYPDASTAHAASVRKLTRRIAFVTASSDDQLAALYRGASGLVFPSLHEGFGIPAIEAMACGVPVIASGTTGLGEVVGNAGLRVDPLDTASIAEAIDRLLSSSDLAEKLALAGCRRVKHFNWDAVVGRLSRTLSSAQQDG